jgi:hypothetical protein
MKSIALALLFLFGTTVSYAEGTPSKQLVAQYIAAAQVEKMIAAQVEGYVAGYTQEPALRGMDKTRIAEYMNATLGWQGIKDQYTALIEKTYSAEELKAAIAFMRTPAGASMTQKSLQFSKDLAAAMTGRTLKTHQPSAVANEQDDNGAAPIDLKAVGVEEHVIGDRSYFTGTVENHGKRSARGVQVEVNLFLGDKFVDQYTAYVSGAVVPGAPRYFKVACGCKDSPPATHDGFKVQVIESY